MIAAARRGVAFTGAGISAESGIPTFRGQDGLWRRYDPAKVASIEAFRLDPGAYWEAARERGARALQARPNPGHLALAALEASGVIDAVVTQNTDGLHGDAGSARVVELHGTGRTVRCLDCGAEEPRAEVQDRLVIEMPPVCRVCGGVHLKPAVVLFGEPMPIRALAQAQALAAACDLMLVVGTSLAVQPAARIPLIAAEAGARIVIVNEEPTPLDRLAAAVLHGRSGVILPRLAELATAGPTHA